MPPAAPEPMTTKSTSVDGENCAMSGLSRVQRLVESGSAS